MSINYSIEICMLILNICIYSTHTWAYIRHCIGICEKLFKTTDLVLVHSYLILSCKPYTICSVGEHSHSFL